MAHDILLQDLAQSLWAPRVHWIHFYIIYIHSHFLCMFHVQFYTQWKNGISLILTVENYILQTFPFVLSCRRARLWYKLLDLLKMFSLLKKFGKFSFRIDAKTSFSLVFNLLCCAHFGASNQLLWSYWKWSYSRSDLLIFMVVNSIRNCHLNLIIYIHNCSRQHMIVQTYSAITKKIKIYNIY